MSFPIFVKIFINGKAVSDFRLGHSKPVKTFIPLDQVNGNIATIDFELNYDKGKKHTRLIDMSEIRYE